MILGLDYQQFWMIFVLLMAFGLAAMIVVGCVIAITLVKMERKMGNKRIKYPDDDLFDRTVR